MLFDFGPLLLFFATNYIYSDLMCKRESFGRDDAGVVGFELAF